MTGLDDPRGAQVDELAFEAERTTRAGRRDDASVLFAQAAAIEAAIARDVAPADDRVRGVLAVSAVALWYKAGRYDDAQQVACEFLAAPQAIDAPSRVELQELLERCWRDREARHLIGADTAFEPVEIKLAGGEIRTGVAPAGAVRERQALAQTLLMRTAELLAKKPFRVRGEASRDISRSVRIFEAPARAASYGVRLFVASGQQQPLPHILAPTPRQIVDTFLEIAASAQQGDGALEELVPDQRYRAAFLAGFRDLAPDGNQVGSVTFQHPVWDARRPQTVYEPHHREEITRRLAPLATSAGTLVVEGVLKVINLKPKAPWIEVVTHLPPATHIFIDVARFEERVREQLNKYVLATCEARPGRRGKGHDLHLLDIASRDTRDELPWEYAARVAVERALADAEWDAVEGVVALMEDDHRGEPTPFEFSSIDELRAELEEIAGNAWHGSVPRDGGEPVFDADVEDIVAAALDQVAEKLAELGWDV